MKFNNKTILITGASTGIGKYLAIELAKIDCNVALLARRKELLDEITAGFRNPKAKLLTLKCDVSQKEDVQLAHAEIKKQFGEVDVAILNAGVGYKDSVKNFNSQYAESTFGINVLGVIYFVECLLPDMLKRKNGVIAGVSSLADNRGFSGSGFYCASKAALTIYLEGLRVDLKQHGIKVITVKPGFVKTPMTDKNEFPMPFLMSAERAAKIIISRMEREKRIISFPLGTTLLSKFAGALPNWLYETFVPSKLKNE